MSAVCTELRDCRLHLIKQPPSVRSRRKYRAIQRSATHMTRRWGNPRWIGPIREAAHVRRRGSPPEVERKVACCQILSRLSSCSCRHVKGAGLTLTTTLPSDFVVLPKRECSLPLSR